MHKNAVLHVVKGENMSLLLNKMGQLKGIILKMLCCSQRHTVNLDAMPLNPGYVIAQMPSLREMFRISIFLSTIHSRVEYQCSK